VVGGGTDVGRPDVPPEVVDVSDGVGTSVGLSVVVGSLVGVGWPWVVSGAGVVVVVGSLGGAVVAVGTEAPVPAGAAAVVSGRM
jgi:hypothetical protein